jgi:GAF domain-containing protein
MPLAIQHDELLIAPATGANAGLILADRRGTMAPIGSYNARNFSAAYAELEAGMPYPQGLAWHTCLTGEVNFTRNYRHDPASIERLHEHLGQAIITVPVGQHATRHTVLGLQYEPDTHVSEADLALLRNICRHLAIILGAVHAYALREASFDEQQMLAWYGRSPREWKTGQARILMRRDVDLDEFSRRTGGHDQPADLGNLAQLRSTLCLPVIYRGNVLAAVNMDNFTREDAFNDDSLRVLKQFAPPVANLLAATFHHDEMIRASITDPLTGLTNRRGYRHDLEQIHARASRMDEPFTLLVMDLTGFKAINDALGHDAGDVYARKAAGKRST